VIEGDDILSHLPNTDFLDTFEKQLSIIPSQFSAGSEVLCEGMISCMVGSLIFPLTSEWIFNKI